jgi:GTP-binding protein
MATAIQEVRFIKSSPDAQSCPESSLPEYAFVGRSNVGKSSLINYLTGNKKLAKTSAQPGKTRLINHFLVDDSWYLVDLPGYGYAKVSRTDRNRFLKLIQDYLKNRESLSCLFVLIDCRHSPQKNDLDFLRWVGENAIPFAICFTKSDKISGNRQKKFLEEYTQTLLREWESLPPVFFSSSVKAKGSEDILEFILRTNEIAGNTPVS